MVHAEPFATDARPAIHATHTEARSELKKPAEQRTHEDCAAKGAYDPAEQPVHAVAPVTALKVPIAHAVHKAEPLRLMYPRAQGVGCTAPRVQNVPAGHGVQTDAPGEDANVPAGHTVQAPAASALKYPTGHREHERPPM